MYVRANDKRLPINDYSSREHKIHIDLVQWLYTVEQLHVTTKCYKSMLQIEVTCCLIINQCYKFINANIAHCCCVHNARLQTVLGFDGTGTCYRAYGAGV